MNLKSSLFSLILCSLVTVQLQAAELMTNTNFTGNSKTHNSTEGLDANLEFAFKGYTVYKNRDLVLLSEKEMQNTEGAWWPVVYHGAGALSGFYGAGYGYLAGGGRSPWGFIGTSLAGGAAGAWSPITGFRSGALTLGGAFSGGAVSGYGTYRGWW